MRVAILSRVAHPFHGFGGLERHVGALVRHLAREGAEVTLCTSPPYRSMEVSGVFESTRVELISYRILPWPRRAGFVVADRVTNYLLWSLRTGRRALRLPVDVVHAEAGAAFGYAALRGSRAAPLVLQAQGMEEFKASWLKRLGYLPLRVALRHAARRAERVLAPDRILSEEVGRYLGVDSERTRVLPLAIDLEEVDRLASAPAAGAIERELAIEKDAVLLLSVGRLESNKGFSVLAASLAAKKAALPPRWRWVLVGTGPEEAFLRRRARELGISDRIRWAGELSDAWLAGLYRRADLFIHPTLYEGSSLVTLEAMAHRKAVVATAAGGIPDKIEHGESGFLVPPGDVEAMGAAIVEALSDPPRLREIGRRARLRVEAEFDWKKRAKRLLEIYREVLAQAQGVSG